MVTTQEIRARTRGGFSRPIRPQFASRVQEPQQVNTEEIGKQQLEELNNRINNLIQQRTKEQGDFNATYGNSTNQEEFMKQKGLLQNRLGAIDSQISGFEDARRFATGQYATEDVLGFANNQTSYQQLINKKGFNYIKPTIPQVSTELSDAEILKIVEFERKQSIAPAYRQQAINEYRQVQQLGATIEEVRARQSLPRFQATLTEVSPQTIVGTGKFGTIQNVRDIRDKSSFLTSKPLPRTVTRTNLQTGEIQQFTEVFPQPEQYNVVSASPTSREQVIQGMKENNPLFYPIAYGGDRVGGLVADKLTSYLGLETARVLGKGTALAYKLGISWPFAIPIGVAQVATKGGRAEINRLTEQLTSNSILGSIIKPGLYALNLLPFALKRLSVAQASKVGISEPLLNNLNKANPNSAEYFNLRLQAVNQIQKTKGILFFDRDALAQLNKQFPGGATPNYINEIINPSIAIANQRAKLGLRTTSEEAGIGFGNKITNLKSFEFVKGTNSNFLATQEFPNQIDESVISTGYTSTGRNIPKLGIQPQVSRFNRMEQYFTTAEGDNTIGYSFKGSFNNPQNVVMSNTKLAKDNNMALITNYERGRRSSRTLSIKNNLNNPAKLELENTVKRTDISVGIPSKPIIKEIGVDAQGRRIFTREYVVEIKQIDNTAQRIRQDVFVTELKSKSPSTETLTNRVKNAPTKEVQRIKELFIEEQNGQLTQVFKSGNRNIAGITSENQPYIRLSQSQSYSQVALRNFGTAESGAQKIRLTKPIKLFLKDDGKLVTKQTSYVIQDLEKPSILSPLKTIPKQRFGLKRVPILNKGTSLLERGVSKFASGSIFSGRGLYERTNEQSNIIKQTNQQVGNLRQQALVKLESLSINKTRNDFAQERIQLKQSLLSQGISPIQINKQLQQLQQQQNLQIKQTSQLRQNVQQDLIKQTQQIRQAQSLQLRQAQQQQHQQRTQQRFKQGLRNNLRHPPRLNPRLRNPPLKPTESFGKKKIPFSVTGKTSKKFDVFARRKGKLIRLNPKPILGESSAKDFLAFKLDKTLRASGFVRPSKRLGSVGIPRYTQGYLNRNVKRFYTNKKGLLVEKRQFRLEKRGAEVKEIKSFKKRL